MKKNVYKFDALVRRCITFLSKVMVFLFCVNTEAAGHNKGQEKKAVCFDKIVQECKNQTMRKNFEQVLSSGNLEAFKKFVSTASLFDILVYNDQEWFAVLNKLYEENKPEMVACLVNNGVCFDVGGPDLFPDSFIEYLVQQESYEFLISVLKKLTFSDKKIIQNPRNLVCFFTSKCPNDLLPYITKMYPFNEKDQRICEGYADLVLDMFDCDEVQNFDQIYQTFFQSLPTNLQNTLLERVVRYGLSLEEDVECLLLDIMLSSVHEKCKISDKTIFRYYISELLVDCVVKKLDNINAVDKVQKKTALMIACQYGHHISVSELLYRGAHPKIVCVEDKKDALLYASASKKNDAYTCIKLLLTMPSTCNVHRKDYFGNDALYYIFRNYSGKELQCLFQILIQRDPELKVNCVYPQNETLFVICM